MLVLVEYIILLYVYPSNWRGDVVRSARVPLLYPRRYAREKLSVRESDSRCSLLLIALCPKRTPVGRAYHYRKRMHSIRRFRTKLTFQRNVMLHLQYIYGVCELNPRCGC